MVSHSSNDDRWQAARARYYQELEKRDPGHFRRLLHQEWPIPEPPAMLDVETHNQIMSWHQSHGGHQGHPAAHALKLLEEVIELCVAAGAPVAAILKVTQGELDKAVTKGEAGRGPNQSRMSEEAADTAICLAIMTYYAGINVDSAARAKLPVLNSRQWSAAPDGTVRRAGRPTPDYDM